MEHQDCAYLSYELSVEYMNDFYNVSVILLVTDPKTDIILKNKRTGKETGFYFQYWHYAKDIVVNENLKWLQFKKHFSLSKNRGSIVS